MTYRGTIRDGVVVFTGGRRPREGTAVEVRPVAAGGSGKKAAKPSATRLRPRRGSPEAVLRHRGTWQGEPGEMERLLAELKRMKQAELEMERARLSQPPKTATTSAGTGATRGSRRRSA